MVGIKNEQRGDKISREALYEEELLKQYTKAIFGEVHHITPVPIREIQIWQLSLHISLH